MKEVIYDMQSGQTIERDYEQVDYRTAEEKLASLRVARDLKLSATDWWASSDLTMTEAQTAYRQALRDITDTYTSLDDVVWPEEQNV
jgi:hypothetical protein